jgi:hypothetical protein
MMSNCVEPEVAITPEMIDAGVSTLLANPRLFETEETVVERVYRAMAARVPS